MLFRREPARALTASQTLSALREAGFEVREHTSPEYVAQRGGSVAVIRLEDGKSEIVRTGRRLGDAIAALVSLGYQTVWRTADGVERAVRAEELEELHAVLEDLRQVLGLTSLYNESLGSTHSYHEYDRAVERK